MPTWSRDLSEPLTTIDGTALRTLADVRAYMLELPPEIASRNSWQRAAALVLAAADAGDIEAATLQVRLALFLGMRLHHG